MRFDLGFKSDDHLKLYLKILGLSSQESPSLTYLNQLIHAHQHQVPFETHTRIVDYFEYLDHLMPIPVYIERLELGAGGVCWTLARGFHWLVKQLGFDAKYYYMDPGHVCVVVTLPEGDFYCEVGYEAPFFKAKPLKSSFLATSAQGLFKYQVKDDSVVVTCTPGPTKTLLLKPQTPAQINSYFEAANIHGNKFLVTLRISKYVNKKLILLVGNKLIGDGPERIVPSDEMEELLITKFRIHPSFYLKAKARIS